VRRQIDDAASSDSQADARSRGGVPVRVQTKNPAQSQRVGVKSNPSWAPGARHDEC
jgi:hypothetical protein